MTVEQPPVLRGPTGVQPGVLRMRVRNVGDAADTCVIRLQAHDAHLIDADGMVFTLAPFESGEQRCEILPAAKAMLVVAVGEGIDGVLASVRVAAIEEGCL